MYGPGCAPKCVVAFVCATDVLQIICNRCPIVQFCSCGVELEHEVTICKEIVDSFAVSVFVVDVELTNTICI